ncbi:MAG: formylmethanofuran dehydrogenase subunit E family protein [Candidatus Hinthialibacter antarcticus]|nr:formylmethanofuran dehydrogenase subunit E family protein [Candidatus Hinthialibacter antarcticus]
MKRTVILATLAAALAAFVYSPSSHMQSTVSFKPVTLIQLERFHGHVGPFVAMGAIMGEYAVTQYHIPRYFGLTVYVECPAKPPHSCLIDGLMVGTGATMGKRNIILTDANAVRVRIENDDTGEQAVFTIKPKILKQLKQWEISAVPVDKRGRDTFKKTAEELFTIEYKEQAHN